MYVFDFITKKCTNSVRIIDELDKQLIVDNLKEKFVDIRIFEHHILQWNSLKEEYNKCKCITPVSQINQIYLPNRNNIYIYLERNKKLFQGSFEVIIKFYEQQEPWEETDIIIFDESYKWLIAFTHEDEIVIIME